MLPICAANGAGFDIVAGRELFDRKALLEGAAFTLHALAEATAVDEVRKGAH